MSDDMEMILAKRMPVSARFIEQAAEHIRTTGVRIVDLLVLSEVPIEGELTCVGVSTRRLLTGPTVSAKPVPMPPTSNWTLDTLSDTVVLDIITSQGPVSTRTIGDSLGIAGGDVSLRNKIRRVLASLIKSKQIRMLGDRRYPKFQSSKMKVRPEGPRTMKRGDITLEMVVAQLSNGPLTSRIVGDNLGIPRHDNTVRSKITEHMRQLQKTGRVRQVHTERDKGERIYELVSDSEAASA